MAPFRTDMAYIKLSTPFQLITSHLYISYFHHKHVSLPMPEPHVHISFADFFVVAKFDILVSQNNKWKTVR